MPSSTETAARTFVAAWQEPDREVRNRLIDACFATDGRIVSRGTVTRGRHELAALIDAFFADSRGLTARLISAIDTQGRLFRFRSVVEDCDGRIVFDGFDAAEVDEDGRIAVLLTFGPGLD